MIASDFVFSWSHDGTVHRMSRFRIVGSGWVASLVAVVLASCTALPAQHAPIKVKLIALNDYHGHLESPGAFGHSSQDRDRSAVGGADQLAGTVAALKAPHRNNVVVAAGDLIGATPLLSSLFHDEPAVETLNRIGLEFSAVGNHEFDKGWAELLRLQRGGCRAPSASRPGAGCQGALVGTPVPFEGARFQWLSANVRSVETGKTLLPAYGVKSFDGVRVAFIGLTLKATSSIVAPSAVAGLEFVDEAQSVNEWVAQIRREGIEAIVVLIHEGGTQSGAVQDINRCDGQLAGSPIADIVSKLDAAVDLVISGHTHAAYNCRLPLDGGRLIPVTSAGAFGRVLSDIDLTLDPRSADISTVSVTNRLVARGDSHPAPDAEVGRIVSAYRQLAGPLSNQVIGSIAMDLPNGAADAACNMLAGNLIADAQLEATRSPETGGSVLAFMNRGGVRSPGFLVAQSAQEGDGNVTYGEAFTVQPFGNNLVTMSLSAQDIKDLLEEQFAGCRGQSGNATRILLPSRGFRYTWNGAAACDARIRSVSLQTPAGTEVLVDESGRVLEASRRYRVTVNDYLAAGGDGFSTLRRGRDALGGPLDIDALSAYLARHKGPEQVYRLDPSDAQRIKRMGGQSCPLGAQPNP